MNLNELTYVAAAAAEKLYPTGGAPASTNERAWSARREDAARIIRDGLLALQHAGHRFDWTPPADEPPEAGDKASKLCMGDLGRAIGRFTESEGGDSAETMNARRGLLDIYERWVDAGRPEFDLEAHE